jgi:hypothetical protein
MHPEHRSCEPGSNLSKQCLGKQTLRDRRAYEPKARVIAERLAPTETRESVLAAELLAETTEH